MALKHAGHFHWSAELDVECPVCGATFDANSTDDFSEQIGSAQICEEVKGCEVQCPMCETKFTFDIASGL